MAVEKELHLQSTIIILVLLKVALGVDIGYLMKMSFL